MALWDHGICFIEKEAELIRLLFVRGAGGCLAMDLAHVEGRNVPTVTPSLRRVVKIRLLAGQVINLRKKAVKGSLGVVHRRGSRIDAPRLTIEADTGLECAHIRTQEVLLRVLLLITCAASVMALAGGQFDLREELLFSIERCLRSRLILLLELVMLEGKMVVMTTVHSSHLHGAWRGGACRLERITATLGQVLAQDLLRCLRIVIRVWYRSVATCLVILLKVVLILMIV